MVNLQPVLDSVRVVILADNQLVTALVTHIFHLWRIVDDVVRCAALAAHASAGQPLHDRLIRNFNVDHMIDLDAHFLQSLCLRHRPRKTVEDKTVFAIILFQTFVHHFNHYCIWHQFTCMNEFLCLLTGLCSVFHSRADDIAGTDLRNMTILTDFFRLGTLSGTGRSEKYNVHRTDPLSGNKLFQETFIVTHHHFRLKLFYSIQRDADDNDDGGTSQRHTLDIGQSCNADWKDCDYRTEHRAKAM